MRCDVSPIACVVTVRCARPASRSILSRNCSRSCSRKKTSTTTRNPAATNSIVGATFLYWSAIVRRSGMTRTLRSAFSGFPVESATRCSVRSTTSSVPPLLRGRNRELLFDVAARRRARDLVRHFAELLIDPVAAEREAADGEPSESTIAPVRRRNVRSSSDTIGVRRNANRIASATGTTTGLREIEHGDDDDRDEESARVRLPAVLAAFLAERAGIAQTSLEIVFSN